MALMSGWGIGSGCGVDRFPLIPQIMIPAKQPLTLSMHGKGFETTGPVIVAASIYGVGYRTSNLLRIANAKPAQTVELRPPEAKA